MAQAKGDHRLPHGEHGTSNGAITRAQQYRVGRIRHSKSASYG